MSNQTKVPEKLLKVVDEIATQGRANLTKLTVLKKWFERPGRLPAFALWLATQAVSGKGKGKAGGEAAALFKASRVLLAAADSKAPGLDLAAAEALYDRLRAFQNEYQHQQWGAVRIVHHWDLMLVEQALEICLWYSASPARGYKLAADYCQNYDSRYGNGLNGPSREKIQEIARFLRKVEAAEDATP
ncbi:MAG: hypothetical protein NTW21_17575 [Verrucomicrobia bacterium]|nr:hypothetical protein [Verrucomicrobiota bacterium]